MAIKWFNINSGETRIAETEPQITAMWASSDHSPNVNQGQDFGWRLAPEVVIEMKRIKQDGQELERIAARLRKPLEDLGESDILTWISMNTSPENAPIAQDGDYADAYDEEVRRLAREKDQENLPETATTTTTVAPTTTTTTTKSLEQLRQELADREASETTTTTTTEAARNTTSTTTKK